MGNSVEPDMSEELPRGKIFFVLCNIVNYSVFNGCIESIEGLLQSSLNK